MSIFLYTFAKIHKTNNYGNGKKEKSTTQNNTTSKSYNKNIRNRYMILDELFRKERTFEELYEELNTRLAEQELTNNPTIDLTEAREKIRFISDRQLHSDIADIEKTYGIALKRRMSEHQALYGYSDECLENNFSIVKSSLSDKEIDDLNRVLVLISKYSTMPGSEWLNEYIPRLQQRFNIKEKKFQPICFEQSADIKGIEHLKVLSDYCSEGKILEIKYQPYNREAEIITVYPYFLKQYNRRWFLICGEEFHKVLRVSNRALDRIESILPKRDTTDDENAFYNIYNKSDFDKMFDNIVGVTIPKEKTKTDTVRLQFTPGRFPYVKTKPIHHSQTFDEKHQTVTIEVIPNKELKQTLLAFGSDVKVLEPASLRKEIYDDCKKMLQNYEDAKETN